MAIQTKQTGKDAGSFSKKTLHLIQLFFTLVGILLSVYMLVQHTRLKSGIQEGRSFCSFGKHIDCDAVNASNFSEVGGVPLATLGACFYFLLFVMSILSLPRSAGYERWQRAIAWFCLVSLSLDVVLLGVQSFVLFNFCVLCIGSYLVTGIIFVTAGLTLNRNKWSGLFDAALKKNIPSSSKIGAGGLTILLICMAVFYWAISMLPTYVRSHSQANKNADNALNQFFQDFKRLPIRRLPVKPGDGTFGNSAAKVQVVEFSDFQCPFCKKAAFTMHTLLNADAGKISFVFKNYPLDKACNDKVIYQMHQYACRLSKLAYCANERGNFWAFHDAVFLNWDTEKDLAVAPSSQNDPLETAVTSGPLKGLFTENQYKDCLKSTIAEENTSEDLHLGNDLGVNGTPSIFIDGKPVTIPLTVENLKHLIDIEDKL